MNYYGVKVPRELSPDGEIYLKADYYQVDYDAGALVFYFKRPQSEPDNAIFTLAPGQWFAVFLASTYDGHPIAVERWEGKLVALRGAA